jgi:hypothetical protein
MTSHSKPIRRESSGSSPQKLSRAERRWRVLRRHSLGATVGLIIPVVGLGVAACGSASSAQTATTTTAVPASVSSSGGFPGHSGSGGGSNARSTNAAGGSLGTVSGVSSSGFTLSTPTGGKVTVKESSSTVYDQGTSKSTASAVTKGTEVLVLGKVTSTTITATQVLLQPSINLKTASANVIGFKKGAGSSKSVGQIPSDYKQGTGKLVSGTKATPKRLKPR